MCASPVCQFISVLQLHGLTYVELGGLAVSEVEILFF